MNKLKVTLSSRTITFFYCLISVDDMNITDNVTVPWINLSIYVCLSPPRRYASRDVNNNSINSVHGHQLKGMTVL